MSVSEYKISLKVRSMARRKRSNTRACPLSLSLIACSIFLFGERGKSVPRLARKGPWNRIMLDRDTLCTLRIPTYTRCKYTRECIIYLYTAPALSACNWSKARLVPPLGWTNGYAQAKANPCASSTSSFSFSTTSSSSNDLHLLLRSKIFASDVTVVELEILFFFSFLFFFFSNIYWSVRERVRPRLRARVLDWPKNFNRSHAAVLSRTALRSIRFVEKRVNRFRDFTRTRCPRWSPPLWTRWTRNI